MEALHTVSTLADFLRRHLIWALLAAYGGAALWPAYGNWLRGLALGELPFTSDPLTATHLLLGTLLLCVGISIRPDETRQLWRMSRLVACGLIGAWLLPAAALGLLLVCCGMAPDSQTWRAFLTGAILVVAMPPANSASVWSEVSGGPAGAAVSAIVLGTLVSPLMTPIVMAGCSGGAGTALESAEMARSLEVLVAFVVLPTVLGIGLRMLFGLLPARRAAGALAVSRLTSMLALLVLNYANAAAAAPQLVADGSPLAALTVSLLTMLLCATVFGLGWLLSRPAAGDDAGRRATFLYVTGMKNTGAALTLATHLLAATPLAVLVPVFYTIAQHLAAAVTDRCIAAARRGAPLSAPATLRKSTTPTC